MQFSSTTNITYKFSGSNQRVTSALGTTDNLGALCGDIFTNINDLDTQAMMQLMDQKHSWPPKL